MFLYDGVYVFDVVICGGVVLADDNDIVVVDAAI